MLGEMRDSGTVETVPCASETGHLVLTTLHAPGAPHDIERVIDMLPANQQDQVRAQLASVVQGVLYQRLEPRAHYVDQVLVVEALLGNQAVQNTIRECKVYQLYSTMQLSFGKGMQTLDQSLAQLCNSGIISRDRALIDYQNRDQLERDLMNFSLNLNGGKKEI
jgi:twitching motility protein PilT